MKLRRFSSLIAVILLASACSTQGSTVATTPVQSPAPSNTQNTCWKSPLTGLCAYDGSPVLIVKIDDVSGARPQRGLNSADVIIVEPVEGGLTRLMAVFHSEDPIEVGPVRSARITDLDLAAAFGNPGFAYSGATTKLRPMLEASALQKVGAPQGAYGYFRVDTHVAPHNLMANTSALFSRIKDRQAARLRSASYWKIEDRPFAGASTHQLIMKWPASEKTFTWDPDLGVWLIRVYDTPLDTQRCCAAQLERATTDTIFIMDTELQKNPISFKRGPVTPYPRTLGEGTGWLLSSGKRVAVTWKRPTAADLPRWFLADGSEVSRPPGRMWWLIQPFEDGYEFRNLAPSETATAMPSASQSASDS